jgi:hypothetical protein
MGRIIEHTERLLLLHDCVIIPDFGGFVLQSVSAVYLREEHLFAPSRKEIVFNPTLTHNDGLLVESYMQRYDTDFDKAMKSVRKDVAEMKEQLNDDAELQFGTVGMFFKENERLIFVPAKDSDKLFSVVSYGLPVFHFLPIAARNLFVAGIAKTSENENETTPTVTSENASEIAPKVASKRGKNVLFRIPVTRTFLHVIAVTAAAILIFVLFTIPVSDVNVSSYSASFVPQEIMPRKTVEELTADFVSYSDEMVNGTVSTEPLVDAADSHIANAAVSSPATVNTPTATTGDSTTPAIAETAPTTSSTETTPSASTATTGRASATKSTSNPDAGNRASTTPVAWQSTATANAAAGYAKYYVIIGSYI